MIVPAPQTPGLERANKIWSWAACVALLVLVVAGPDYTWLFAGTLFGWLGMNMAFKRGRNPRLWGAACAAFGLIAVFVLWIMGERK